MFVYNKGTQYAASAHYQCGECAMPLPARSLSTTEPCPFTGDRVWKFCPFCASPAVGGPKDWKGRVVE